MAVTTLLDKVTVPFANRGEASASRLSTLANRGFAAASPIKETNATVVNFMMSCGGLVDCCDSEWDGLGMLVFGCAVCNSPYVVCLVYCLSRNWTAI